MHPFIFLLNYQLNSIFEIGILPTDGKYSLCLGNDLIRRAMKVSTSWLICFNKLLQSVYSKTTTMKKISLSLSALLISSAAMLYRPPSNVENPEANQIESSAFHSLTSQLTNHRPAVFTPTVTVLVFVLINTPFAAIATTCKSTPRSAQSVENSIIKDPSILYTIDMRNLDKLNRH